jgi:hypothetical protein
MSLSNFFRRIAARPALSHGNPLEGKRLRYLIGCDGDVTGKDGEIFVVGYDVDHPPLYGIGVGYCNLFDEKNRGEYGPYLHSSDTAARYREGQVDPRGPGFERNLCEQLRRRKAQGFRYVELDNPDAYSVADVLRAVRLAAAHTLAVLAKNPLLMEGDPTQYVAECRGVIVERGAGSPPDMDALRRRAAKPDMPVWFVAFGSGRSWAEAVARQARNFRNMYVTYSSAGEYGSSIDVELAP